MPRYYLYLDGRVAGPFAAEAVHEQALPSTTMACLEGSEEWRQISEIPELLAPPTEGPSVLPSPLAGSADVDVTERKKIFIIHGRGNTMDNAFDLLVKLIRCKIRYYQGKFYADAENSNFIRYLLYASHDNPWTQLYDRMIIGKIALSPFFPPPADWTPDRSWSPLSEFKVSDKLEQFAVPTGVTGGGKRQWCDRFFESVWNDFSAALGVKIESHPALSEAIHALRMSLRPPDGGLYLEAEYKDAIRRHFTALGRDPESFVQHLIEFQRLNDAGGDLDTIASNALYGAWLMQAFQAKYGRLPRYGRDFEFDFVNYHQSFLHLARHKNCELYLPDFPMDAIPDLEEAAKAIIEAGSYLVRIDDHHPMDRAKMDLLERLKREGLFGDFFMSGPVKGEEEQSEEEKTCGADLVHREMLARRGLDSPGLEELRRLAHQQDLHLIENPDDREHPDYLAIDLSKLIGSKYSRLDMAQQLMQVRSHDDIRGIMERTGWRKIVDDYEQELERLCPQLEKCLCRMEFIDPKDAGGLKKSSGFKAVLAKVVRAITMGKVDLELGGSAAKAPRHRITMTLAPFQTRKEHRINVASAINYLKRYHRFDYFFYAWGASLLTTRRFNDQDQTMNLSTLMPIIGGPGDGGHPSAATCKPPSNAAWPAERFKKLNKSNFLEYGKYIAGRIEAGLGMRVLTVEMINETHRDFPDGSGPAVH